MRQSFSSAATAGINNVASPPAMPSFPSDSFLFPTSNDCNNENNASISASATQGESRLDNASQSDRALLHLKQHYLHECFQMDHLHVPQTPAAFEHDHDREGELESHEDSFYASLMAAQQLRRQRETTARGSAVDTTTATASVALRSHASSALSASTVGSPCLSPPPRTLQELLTWRQEMLDARMREHAVWQQQQRQPPTTPEFSWSLGSRSPGSDVKAGTARRPNLLTPQVPSPPFLSSGSGKDSSFASPLPPAMLTKEASYASRDFSREAETEVSEPCTTTTCPPSPFCPSPRLPPVPSSPPLRGALTRQASTSSSALSASPAAAALVRRSPSNWMDVSGRWADREEVADSLRLHDSDFGQSVVSRIGLFFMLLLAIALVCEGPFLPGGALGML